MLFLVVPLVGLVVRAPWGQAWTILHGSAAGEALRLSLWTSTTATAISLLIGVPLAWVLARTDFPGLRLLRALVTLPLVLPPVVGGVALLLAFGRSGFVGQYLDQWFGITLPFTPAAVVIAETFVAMPFLVVTVEGALRSADRGFEEAAATLGAEPDDGLPAGHRAADRAVARGRRGALLGARARRVRCHDHVRRQLPRPHADHADRRLLRPRDRSGRGHPAEPGAAARVGRGARRAARPVAPGGAS